MDVDSAKWIRNSKSEQTNAAMRSKKMTCGSLETINAESLFASHAQQRWRGWRDFEGHRTGNIAQLYPKLIVSNEGGGGGGDLSAQ